jgi:hypothetical protein
VQLHFFVCAVCPLDADVFCSSDFSLDVFFTQELQGKALNAALKRKSRKPTKTHLFLKLDPRVPSISIDSSDFFQIRCMEAAAAAVSAPTGQFLVNYASDSDSDDSHVEEKEPDAADYFASEHVGPEAPSSMPAADDDSLNGDADQSFDEESEPSAPGDDMGPGSEAIPVQEHIRTGRAGSTWTVRGHNRRPT